MKKNRIKVIGIYLIIFMNISMINAQMYIESITMESLTDTVAYRSRICLDSTYNITNNDYPYKRIPILIRSTIRFNDNEIVDGTLKKTEYNQKTVILHENPSIFENEFFYTICFAKHYDYRHKQKTKSKFYQFEEETSKFDLIITKKEYKDLLHIPLDANLHFKDFDNHCILIVIKDKRDGKGSISIKPNNPQDSIQVHFWNLNHNIPNEPPHQLYENNFNPIWLFEGKYEYTITGINTDIPNQILSDTITIKEGKPYFIDISQKIGTLSIENKTTDNYFTAINSKEFSLSKKSTLPLKLIKRQDYSLSIKKDNYSYPLDTFFEDNTTYYFGKRIESNIKADSIWVKSQSNFLDKELLDKLKSYPPGTYNLLLQKDNRKSRIIESMSIPFNDNNESFPLNYKLKRNWNKPIKWGVLGIGTINLGIGVYTFIKSECLYKDYKSATNTNEATNLHKSFDRYRRTTYISGGIAAISFSYTMIIPPIWDEKFKKNNRQQRDDFFK